MTQPSQLLADIVTAVQTADKLFDAAAPFLGVAEFTPLADALTTLLEKVQQASLDKGKTPAAAVTAADMAADAAEDLKFPVGSK